MKSRITTRLAVALVTLVGCCTSAAPAMGWTGSTVFHSYAVEYDQGGVWGGAVKIDPGRVTLSEPQFVTQEMWLLISGGWMETGDITKYPSSLSSRFVAYSKEGNFWKWDASTSAPKAQTVGIVQADAANGGPNGCWAAVENYKPPANEIEQGTDNIAVRWGHVLYWFCGFPQGNAYYMTDGLEAATGTKPEVDTTFFAPWLNEEWPVGARGKNFNAPYFQIDPEMRLVENRGILPTGIGNMEAWTAGSGGRAVLSPQMSAEDEAALPSAKSALAPTAKMVERVGKFRPVQESLPPGASRPAPEPYKATINEHGEHYEYVGPAPISETQLRNLGGS